MKRTPMTLQLETQAFDRAWPYREIQADDADDLAILLYAAFRGTIDDEGEPFSAAVSEIEKTMAGNHGRLLADCSFVIAENNFISSACLISWYEPAKSPFVVFTMTHPESKMKGMARFLLKKSINALILRGDRQLTLIVTDGNDPAQYLYASLGFEPVADA